MGDQVKNIIIGIFVIAAVAIVIFILLFLHPTLGDEKETLNVRFTDIDKVNIGTRVTFAGKAVGEVLKITEMEDGRDGPKDSSGHIYVYQLKLGLDSHVIVYDTDEITLRTSGLLGERSVAIIPRAPNTGQVPKRVSSKDILYSTETTSVEEAMKDFTELAATFKETLETITATVKDVRKEEVVKHISAVAQNLADITMALNKPEEWSAMVDNFQDFSSELATRLPPSWDTFDATLDEFHSTATNTRNITSKTEAIVADIGEGKGSVGKLLMRDDLYINLKAVLNKVETLGDDVNHYGLLFHLDKGWQRLRARRLNLMQKLSTPQEFRNFFNDEMNQITTSLSRVSMVLDSTEAYCTCWAPYSLMEDPNFQKVFAELLRKVDTMQEALNLYNQQLVECEVQKTELVPCCQEQWQ